MKQDFTIEKLGEASEDSPLETGFLPEDEAILVDPIVSLSNPLEHVQETMELAGPRQKLFFSPEKCRAAIVTCGGLCPGLNDVIRAVTMVLWYRYGVQDILGLRYGYEGLVTSSGHKPVKLTPETVADIHKDGGTILGSSRGPQDTGKIVDFLSSNRINILFTVGGDGTQRGALEITQEIKKRNLTISVVGIPKTIDNDIMYTERTFGFETAVAMSQTPITCAHMESKGARNGVGLVKLMGRESGFVAAYASLASSDVNLLLVPEVPFKPYFVFDYLEKRLRKKAHAVIVVAEGAGQDLMEQKGFDASGNRKLADVGPFLKQIIIDHFKELNIPVSVKYIDPSYTIRSAPASADDSVFCFQLSDNAVHAALSGRTAMIIGFWNGHFTHVPMERAVEGRKKIDPSGLLWKSVLDNTGQPANLG